MAYALRKAIDCWYFAPLERFAVYEAAKYLIEANASPHSEGIHGRDN